MRFAAFICLVAAPASGQTLPSPCQYESVLIDNHQALVSFITETMEACNSGAQTGPVCERAQRISANENPQTLEAMKAWVMLPALGRNCD